MKQVRVLLWLVWSLLLPLQALAALPTVELLRKNLDGLAERKLPEAEQQSIQQALEQTLAWMEQAEQARLEQQQLEQQLAAAPQKIRHNEDMLKRVLQEAERQKLPEQASLAELERQVAVLSPELDGWQKDLADANALIVRTQTRPERAQIEIGANQKRIREITDQLKLAKEGGKPLLQTERVNALNAELEALQERARLRQAELAGNSILQDLASSSRELLAARVEVTEKFLHALQVLLSEKRQAASERAVQEQSLEVERAGEDTLLLKESNINLRLSDYLLTLTERRNKLTQKGSQVRQQLDNLQQVDQALDEQISVLQGSLLLARILYQQKQALPQLSFDRNLAEQIADTRLNQFELRQHRDRLQRPEEYVDQKLAGMQGDVETVRSAMLELVRTRSGLLERLNHEINTYLSDAIAVQLNQKQLQAMAVRLDAVLDEQMFWVPSNKPLDKGWFKKLPTQLGKQIKQLDAGAVLAELRPVWSRYIAGFLPALLLTGLILWKRKPLRMRILHSHANIGHYLHDRQYYTPLAVLAVVLLALPAAAWVGSAGWIARLYSQGAAHELGNALVNMAQLGLVFSVAYRLLAEKGVAQVHLQWSAATACFLRRHIAAMALVVWSMALVIPLAQANLAKLSDDVLGILLLTAGFLSISTLTARLLLHNYEGQQLSLFVRLLGMILVVLPLVLIGALAAGYYYTVLQLGAQLLTSLSLLMVWLICRAMLERGLTIAARRLAWRRVQALQEQEDDGQRELPDIVQANEQSLRLARFMLLLGLVALLYWVWSDVISQFAYLDNVVLYESGSADAASSAPLALLSLRSLMNALVIVGMTVMLARNLPGLLEVLFLSRFKITQGSSYATLRLLSYSIFSVGLVATLGALGVSWGKLQWLVAALSVGLGFGLQEIFANFVSGLIILFERPVRVGDLVTIGDMSGTVSRIRIRATTIVDFDRKEIIMPNKVFVTERLLNWSLTDSVTRITLHIRLAYDTDLELARKLMLQCMQENSRVLADPEPVVLFLEVGPSSFNHEMRYHVGEISDRNPSIDEVHNRLVERFRDAGIQMAFQQMDVHIRSRQGDEVGWSAPPGIAPG